MNEKWFGLAARWGLFFFFVAVIAFVFISSGWNRSRHHITPKTACISMLKEIDGAKVRWALERGKKDSDIPDDTDLFGPGKYIIQKLKCPEGGTYTLGRIGERARCSIPTHRVEE